MAITEKRLVLQDFGKPGSHTIKVYEEGGGYSSLKKILLEDKNKWTPQAIIEEVKTSNLRGRGGAGFPTGLKWSFVPRDSKEPKYTVCNADESEPGTFKDKAILEELPHGMIEGMIICGIALGSHHGFIYIRGEFYKGWQVVEQAIKETYRKGYLGDNILGSGYSFHLNTFRGAGAYICGEETALLDSLEGKRGQPRLKPPFPAVKGLYGCPTVVNNVETFCAIPHIIKMGGKAYSSLGVGNPKSGGTKVYSISGNVKRPGVYELPLGVRLIDIIQDIAGGTPKGRKLKAVVPGGSSTPILSAEEVEDNAIMDYEGMVEKGTFLGSGGLIVLDDSVDMIEFAYRVAYFYAKESCGQCTPCREGSRWVKDIVFRIREGSASRADLDTLISFTDNMWNGTTICAFSDAVVMGITPILQNLDRNLKPVVGKRKPRSQKTSLRNRQYLLRTMLQKISHHIDNAASIAINTVPQLAWYQSNWFWTSIKIGLLFFLIITGAAYYTLMERKWAGYFQDRYGPNRAGLWGFFQPLADGIKFLTKMETIPRM